MRKLTKKEKERIEHFRSLFSKKIKVKISFCEEGGFCAEVLTFQGCFTEAETFSELIEMVNDAVATVLEVPREYLSYMPSYMPPLSLAQDFNIFPAEVTEAPVIFSIP